MKQPIVTGKQITEVEKIISELEDNPNSPFHKLVNLDEQKQKLFFQPVIVTGKQIGRAHV